MLLLGNVGGRQEIRNIQRGWLTGTHAHFCEEGTVEGTRVILSRESKLGVGRNACSEIKHLSRPANVAIWMKLLWEVEHE